MGFRKRGRMKTIYSVWLLPPTIEYSASLRGLFKNELTAKEFLENKSKEYSGVNLQIIPIETDLFESEEE